MKTDGLIREIKVYGLGNLGGSATDSWSKINTKGGGAGGCR